MTLDKAIKIQTIHNDHNPNFTDAERREAHQLSIAALTAIMRYRQRPNYQFIKELPGETKD